LLRLKAIKKERVIAELSLKGLDTRCITLTGGLQVNIEDFVGRDAEARAILANTQNKHSSLIIADAGIGKTALIEFISPVLKTQGKHISCTRVGPGFGSFLKEIFDGLWQHSLIPQQTSDLEADYKTWAKKHSSNDLKAQALISLCEKAKDVIITIDDATSVTPSSRPWLIKLVETSILIAAIDPNALKKAGTKRFWKLFDEVKLEPLSKQESSDFLEKLMNRYNITTDDKEIYQRSVLDLSQGSPFEIQRLVKYHSSETLIKSREVISGSHSFVERDARQIALAPILLILGAFTIAGRYISRVQGDMDVYVLSAIGLGLLVVFAPLLRSALKPRSR